MLHLGQDTNKAEVVAQSVVTQLAPWLAELILACRLLAVFPYRSTPRLTFIAIFAFPVIVKSLRLFSVIAYFVDYGRKYVDASGNAYEDALQHGFRDSPWAKMDWILQIFDNAYV